MSVLIKGMEMPQNCFGCPFMYARRFCSCNPEIEFTDDEYSELQGRYDGCPLVEVPPHGRLIEGDKLMDKIWMGEVYPGYEIERRIKAAPTIIPAEEEET